MLSSKVHLAFQSTAGVEPISLTHFRRKGRIQKTYAILITPRSGSTWLTHEIAALNVLGCPEEFFNIDNLAEALRYNPAGNVVDLFDSVADKMSTNAGLFGFQISYFDLQHIETEVPLLSLMQGAQAFVYLTRKNFVEQGLSLYAATATGQFHSVAEGKDQPNCRMHTPPYDADKIRFWITHILQQEYGFEMWLNDNNVSAFPIHYEDLVEDINESIGKISAYIGFDGVLPSRNKAAKTTRKLQRVGLADMEALFRNEEAEFCSYWEQNRGRLPCSFEGPSQ